MNNPILSPSGNAAAYWQTICDNQVQTIRQLRQTLLKVENLLVATPVNLREVVANIHTTLEATR